MSRARSPDKPRVYWAAVCDCGWAASSRGTAAERTQIESLGRTHDGNCEDDGSVYLERRSDDTEVVEELTQGGQR